MNRILLKFLFVICLCLVPTFGSYAADTTESSSNDDEQDWYDAAPELDDKGRRIKGTFDCMREQKNSKVDKQWVWKGFFACTDGCAYWLKHDVQSSGSLSWTTYEFVCTSTNLSNQSYRLFYTYNDNKNPELSNSKISSNFEKYYYDYYGEDDTGSFSSSLPIFKAGDTDAINAYLENGDASGAENSTDIADQDDSVEMPRNLKLTGGYAQKLSAAYSIDKDIVLNWDQTVDTTDYKYTVEAQVTMDMKSSNFGASHNTGKHYSSDWIEFKNADYEGAKQVGLTLNHKELDTKLIESFLNNYVKQTGEKVPYKGYSVANIKVRVRNYFGDKASNYVVISIDKESVTNTATVEDENGNKVEDPDNSDYDGETDITDKQDSQDLDLSGLGDVLDMIRNGFGLFGSNGLIAMFSKFFSFLPNKYWSLILLGVSLMVFVGVVNFLLKR